MSHSTLLDENFPARLEAVFPDRAAAEAAASALCQRFGLSSSQISIATPQRQPVLRARNRFASRAVGRVLQRRQISYTLIAFSVLLVGFGVLQLLGAAGILSQGTVSTVLSALIVAAILLTVTGLLFWGPEGVTTRSRQCRGNEAALMIEVHSLSEQYELRQALLELGGRAETADITRIS